MFPSCASFARAKSGATKTAMKLLYHLWISPASRMARIALGEKKLEFKLKAENVWERRDDFLALNPMGDLPVLVEDEGRAISGIAVILEYLDEVSPEPGLIGAAALARAEARRLMRWFDVKFQAEVIETLVEEKLTKRFLGHGGPDSGRVRAGHANMRIHMDYLTWLLERRNYLAGDNFSIADIAAAAHLSCVDYIGDVPWDRYEAVKDWYARVKSRPSFRPVLNDVIPGAPPPAHYADLDF